MSDADIEKNINISHLFDYYGGLLTERQQEVVGLYYNDDLSLGEIAELIGITRQGVRNAVKKGEALLTNYEAILGFAGKFDAVTEAAESLIDIIDKIDKTVLDPEIKHLSDRLKYAIQAAFI